MVSHIRLDAAFPDVLDLACSPVDHTFVCSTVAPGSSARPVGKLLLWNMRTFKKVNPAPTPAPKLKPLEPYKNAFLKLPHTPLSFPRLWNCKNTAVNDIFIDMWNGWNNCLAESVHILDCEWGMSVIFA